MARNQLPDRTRHPVALFTFTMASCRALTMSLYSAVDQYDAAQITSHPENHKSPHKAAGCPA
ncbi:hypothetical protein KCP78_22545 [Salmonella enterica subsp. enterica]|nr:hypothetical protein KCP78_22545 [Salmonella enterica subsp. enterica]